MTHLRVANVINNAALLTLVTSIYTFLDTKHVMISYQWDVQTLVIQLKNKLQADGYKVWMDIDEMGGSTLESMAKAVENASVVLVCVSQKYKESPNCRSGTLFNISQVYALSYITSNFWRWKR